MNVQIQSRDIRITKALRAHVELRLGFALSRFGEHINRIMVHLSKTKEHHSAPDKRCRIQIGLPRSVSVQEIDADLFSAVDRAADRIARSVARVIELDRERLERTSPKHPIRNATAPARSSPKEKMKSAPKRSSKFKQKRSSVPLHK